MAAPRAQPQRLARIMGGGLGRLEGLRKRYCINGERICRERCHGLPTDVYNECMAECIAYMNKRCREVLERLRRLRYLVELLRRCRWDAFCAAAVAAWAGFPGQPFWPVDAAPPRARPVLVEAMRIVMGLRSDIRGLTAFPAFIADERFVSCLANCRPSDEAAVYGVCVFGEYVQSRRRNRRTNVLTPLLGGYRVDALPGLLDSLYMEAVDRCSCAVGEAPEATYLVMRPL